MKQEVVQFLKNRYKPKAIILVGSRAVGDFKPKSDWDIYIYAKSFRKETPNQFYKALPQKLKNEDLDIYKISINDYPEKMWRDLRNSEILFDSDKLAIKLVNKAQKLYKKGPKKWTKAYAQGRVYKAQRYMKKFEDNYKDKNYNELFLRICWHYTENVVNWWFGIRREFPLRPQQAFPYIKKKDPSYYKLLQVVTSESSYKSKINAFKRMHSILFSSKEFKQLIK